MYQKLEITDVLTFRTQIFTALIMISPQKFEQELFCPHPAWDTDTIPYCQLHTLDYKIYFSKVLNSDSKSESASILPSPSSHSLDIFLKTYFISKWFPTAIIVPNLQLTIPLSHVILIMYL